MAAAAQLTRATVKAVISGDTVIVMGPAHNGPPPEKQLTLSGIMAPRLGRRDGTTKDEPFAWQSKEFLRKKLIGKNIAFRLEQSVAAIGRDFGSIFLEEENIAASVVAAGWAKTKGSKDARTEEFEELVRLEGQAQEAGLGMWTKEEGAAAASIRNVLLPEAYNANDILEAAGKEPQDAVIDQVMSGSTVRAFLLPRFIYITLHLSGIQCPSIRREGEQEVAEPLAREAKFFSESRLLNRDVQIVLEGVDKFQNFFGSVRHPAGNISEFLLVNGLAKIVEWSIKNNRDKDKLYAAERAAKQNRLRLWKDYVPPVAATISGAKEFVAKIVEIVSGDVLVVRDAASDDALSERRIALSSIRAPRAGNAKAATQDEPYCYEAKEYLRTRFIGKKVKVTVDYVRAIPAGGDKTEDRTFATVESDKGNLAVALVSAGLANVVRHRGDEPRSVIYDELLQLEAQAEKEGKGVFSKGKPPKRHVNDVSTPAQAAAAKQFFPSLQRAGRMKGIVDFVANGSRLKLCIPKESCIVAVGLSGVRCPAAARRDKEGDAGEPFGDAAYYFTRNLCLQHDVEFEVETQDKVGTFIGTVWVGGKNLAILLLQQGLAFIQPGMRPERTMDGELLLATEAQAKKAQIGMWRDYVEPAATEEQEESDISPESLTVVCTHVVDAVTVFLQSSVEAKELPKLQEMLSKMGASSSSAGFNPKNGEMLCARFVDGVWYRARVLRKSPEGIHVLFVDYGNDAVVSSENIRPIPPSLSAAAPLAKECQLAFLKAPKEDDIAEDAYNMTAGALLDKEFGATIEWKDPRTGRLHVTLTQPGAAQSFNTTLLREGLARVTRFKKPRERLEQQLSLIRPHEEYAKRSRLNIWRYGDCVESDDEDNRRR